MPKNIKLIIGITFASALFIGIFQFLKKHDTKKIVIDDFDMNKPWVVNAYHNFSFETPEPVKKENVQQPAGFGSHIKEFDVYFCKEKHLVTMFLFMNTDFVDYDPRTGLQNSIQNSIQVMGGKDLMLDFKKPDGDKGDILAGGEYKIKDEDILVQGYAYWNKKGQIAILVAMIRKSEANEKAIKKIIDSRKIMF